MCIKIYFQHVCLVVLYLGTVKLNLKHSSREARTRGSFVFLLSSSKRIRSSENSVFSRGRDIVIELQLIVSSWDKWPSLPRVKRDKAWQGLHRSKTVVLQKYCISVYTFSNTIHFVWRRKKVDYLISFSLKHVLISSYYYSLLTFEAF